MRPTHPTFLSWGHRLGVALAALPALFLAPCVAFAQNSGDDPGNPDAEGLTEMLQAGSDSGMDLFQLLQTGGWIMAVLALLSIVVVTLALYYTLALTERRLAPPDLVLQFRHLLMDGRIDDVARICQARKGMLCEVILSGITEGREGPGSNVFRPEAVGAAMEQTGRREADLLMRKVRYFSEIATVSPMLGLLGTVIGMIRAFNGIAFSMGAVKQVMLASAVSQALITTAAGLIVAIPAMALYFIFRGRLQTLLGRVEVSAVAINDMIVRAAQLSAQGQNRYETDA